MVKIQSCIDYLRIGRVGLLLIHNSKWVLLRKAVKI
nr:MAG TPA: hypothetical protein [Caudoviricetes sp.]DAQ95509.1 MAG TPA: hypothetical protein [Caudoviricetes sp.]